jgi:hypothetical protein
MHRFDDRNGFEWDVVLGRESWGAVVALFVPRTGTLPVRQASLAAPSYEAAVQEFNALDSAALQALLDRSTIRQEEQ